MLPLAGDYNINLLYVNNLYSHKFVENVYSQGLFSTIFLSTCITPRSTSLIINCLLNTAAIKQSGAIQYDLSNRWSICCFATPE